MKFPNSRKAKEAKKRGLREETKAETRPEGEAPTLPALIAGAFTRLRLAQRARVLRRLLIPIGPMALVVLGGGVFAKYAAQARWSRMSVSLDDAASVTAGQVYELVRYVEQSNPVALQHVLAALARDGTTMAALGASIAALVMQHLAARQATRPAKMQ